MIEMTRRGFLQALSALVVTVTLKGKPAAAAKAAEELLVTERWVVRRQEIYRRAAYGRGPDFIGGVLALEGQKFTEMAWGSEMHDDVEKTIEAIEWMLTDSLRKFRGEGAVVTFDWGALRGRV